MNYQETLNYIHSLGMFSHRAGLERITAALEILGNPQNQFDAVHIAGTNGKGSVVAFVSSVFRKAGLKTAVFVSPYIVDFRERIQINGEYISEGDLCRLSQRVIETGVSLTEFEFITAVAFLCFAEQKCDIAVIETGLGGRLDATNTLTRKKASVITKIGLDHTLVLGGTIKKIAAEKCGIIKKSVTISAPRQRRSALNVIRAAADNLIVPDLRALRVKRSDISGNAFTYRKKYFETTLLGAHQIENAVTAIEVVEATGFVKRQEDIYEGIKEAQIPARLEVLNCEPLIVIDGAHNIDGALVLQKFLKQQKNVTAVVGMMKDKDYSMVLKETLPYCENVICVGTSVKGRGLNEELLSIQAQKYAKNVYTAKNVKEGIALAQKISEKNPIFIFGSLYLASEARSILI